MKKRILIQENSAAANELIAYEQLKSSNGQKLIAMLDKLGLTLTQVTEWNTDVIQPLSKPFPSAPITFNVEAIGLRTEYEAAELFYSSNRHNMRFTSVTDKEIEEIKENSRTYADSPEQVEAYELMQSIISNAKRLKELGIRVELEGLRHLHPVFYGGNMYQELILNPRELASMLTRLIK